MSQAHVDVRPAVVVEIGGGGAHSVGAGRPPVLAHEGGDRGAVRIADAGLFGDILKRAVAAIAIQQIGAAAEALRAARHRNLAIAAVEGRSRLGRARGVEGHVVGDEQIEVAVAIVIEETAARAPTVLDAGHARLLGDIREGAVAVVAVEHVSPEVGDEEIVEPVVVVVADTTPPDPIRSGSGRLCA